LGQCGRCRLAGAAEYQGLVLLDAQRTILGDFATRFDEALRTTAAGFFRDGGNDGAFGGRRLQRQIRVEAHAAGREHAAWRVFECG
jgi:hypothetical protein